MSKFWYGKLVFFSLFAVSGLIFSIRPQVSYGMDVTLAWEANTEPDIDGYYLYYKTGTSGPPYEVKIDVGNVITYTVYGLEDTKKYFFAFTAYDSSDLESSYSDEVEAFIGDTSPPVPDVDPLPEAKGECEVVLVPPTATDESSGTITATTDDPLVYTDQGIYTVTWQYDDGHGNTTTQTQQVIVADDNPPEISCPQDITVQQTGPLGETIDLGEPTVEDTCDAEPTLANDAPEIFNQGTTIVNWIATDSSGNSSSCTQVVEVVPPGIPDLTGHWIGLQNFWIISWGKFQLENIGNGDAVEKFKVEYYLSEDGTTPGRFLDKMTYISGGLTAGQSETLYFWASAKNLHPWTYLMAVINAEGQVPEANKGNNIIAIRLP